VTDGSSPSTRSVGARGRLVGGVQRSQIVLEYIVAARTIDDSYPPARDPADRQFGRLNDLDRPLCTLQPRIYCPRPPRSSARDALRNAPYYGPLLVRACYAAIPIGDSILSQSQPGASQAGILLAREDIPASFRWSRRRLRDDEMTWLGASRLYGGRIETGMPATSLLRDDSRAVGNLLSGESRLK